MKKFLATIITFSLLIWAGSASATVITDLYGDKDGFEVGLADGDTNPYLPLLPIVQNDSADAGTVTDLFMYSEQSWTHTYNISSLGLITSASLEIMTYGQGWHGASTIYFDNVYLGTLTDGDNTGEDNNPDVNIAWRDTFDLSPFIGSLNGTSTIKIVTAETGDFWYLDYSELTITGDPNPVPEPVTMTLFGLGLLGLAGVKRLAKTNKDNTYQNNGCITG